MQETFKVLRKHWFVFTLTKSTHWEIVHDLLDLLEIGSHRLHFIVDLGDSGQSWSDKIACGLWSPVQLLHSPLQSDIDTVTSKVITMRRCNDEGRQHIHTHSLLHIFFHEWPLNRLKSGHHFIVHVNNELQVSNLRTIQLWLNNSLLLSKRRWKNGRRKLSKPPWRSWINH